MSLKIGINGFGRMGRLALRAGWGMKNLDFVQINEIAGDLDCSAHLLKYDSVHGQWHESVSTHKKSMLIDGEAISYTRHQAIEETDWSDCDLVLEATGRFRDTKQLASYFKQGVKKVVVAAPVKGALNIVMGVNDDQYKHGEHHLVTAASCTTNCLAPIVKVMQRELGIVHGTATTLHDITNTQQLVDRGHRDLRRARSALNSLIPTSTGSASAIVDIFPELKGKLDGLAVRVPLLNASLLDFVFESKKKTTEKAINELFQQAALDELSGILGFESLPLVSADFCNDTRSAVIDGPSTMVIDGNLVKVLAWYDNEMGYAQRLVELIKMIAKQDRKQIKK